MAPPLVIATDNSANLACIAASNARSLPSLSEWPNVTPCDKEENSESLSNAAAAAANNDSNDSNSDGKGNRFQRINDAKRQRRSRRDTDRIILSSSRDGALQFRRMEELFFREPGQDSSGLLRRSSRRRRRRFLPPPGNSKRLENQPTDTVKVDKFVLERVHVSPNIYVVDDFLTESDLEFLHQAVHGGSFQKSYVDATERGKDGSLLDASHRTSTFLSFTKQQNAKVAAIEQRAAQLMGCYSTDQIEPLQLVRYLPGQFFGVHHDMGDYNEDTGSVELPPKNVLVKRRLVTIFCYLNDLEPDQGGCTGFPLCSDLKVQPKQGRAVLFSNVTAHGMPDPRTIHAGETVQDKRVQEVAVGCTNQRKTKKKGKPPIKYGLNIWICES